MNRIYFDNKNVCIQIANETHAHEIAKINAIAWQKAYRDLLPKKILDAISTEKWTESWKIKLKNNITVLIIQSNNRVLGFSYFSRNKIVEAQGEINAIYLHPSVWRKGFGKKLCLASLDKLFNTGVKEVIIWVLQDNFIARKFYESLGFKESGLLRIYQPIPSIQLNEIQYVKLLLG